MVEVELNQPWAGDETMDNVLRVASRQARQMVQSMIDKHREIGITVKGVPPFVRAVIVEGTRQD